MYDDLIHSYKNLLFAIFNTNSEESKRSIICVYDTKDNDRLIAIFNSSKECAKFFDTGSRCIDSIICKKNLRNHRFRLERLKYEKGIDKQRK